MPAYLIRHAKGQLGDILIDEPDLTITLTDQWADFNSNGTLALGIPRERIASIQRIDPDDGHQPDGDTTDEPTPEG